MPLKSHLVNGLHDFENLVVKRLSSLTWLGGDLINSVLIPKVNQRHLPDEHDCLVLLPWAGYTLEVKAWRGEWRFPANRKPELLTAKPERKECGTWMAKKDYPNPLSVGKQKASALHSFLQAKVKPLSKYPVLPIVVFPDDTTIAPVTCDVDTGDPLAPLLNIRIVNLKDLEQCFKSDMAKFKNGKQFQLAEIRKVVGVLQAERSTEPFEGLALCGFRLERRIDVGEVYLHVPSRLDVYAAVHDFTKTPAHVFLYQKSPWNEDTERFLRHAERRAKALYRCAAPRVIRLYNAQDLPDQLFLAQEAYEGLNLDATVQKRGRLPPKLVRSVLRHLAVTVAGLHDAGVRHLDIRPEYVLVGGHLDAHGGSQHRLTGLTNPMIDDAVVSTVVYNHSYEQSFTAQEMCQSDHSDRGKPQVDIFSLGRLGAFLLLGKDAYRDRVTAQAVDGPDFALPTTDARLVRTLQRAMDRRPAARQSSAADLADELREA